MGLDELYWLLVLWQDLHEELGCETESQCRDTLHKAKASSRRRETDRVVSAAHGLSAKAGKGGRKAEGSTAAAAAAAAGRGGGQARGRPAAGSLVGGSASAADADLSSDLKAPADSSYVTDTTDSEDDLDENTDRWQKLNRERDAKVGDVEGSGGWRWLFSFEDLSWDSGKPVYSAINVWC